ncbi:MAG: recombinase family protein [Clostridia bacterium]
MSETVQAMQSAQAGKDITVFPATIQRYSVNSASLTGKKRVAGYARVSTDDEEQQNSYEAQVDYYARYIQSKPEWTFVEVYTDEGISATNTKKREGFNRMIADALAGRIDLIVTKSVSRFARNTVDTLTTIRKLKEKGVGVVFEKENIDTLDSKGELLITIMSSLAQEESRSISENVTWGQRKRFSDGKVTMPYSHFLGYERGDDGAPRVVESEAKVVRQIYAMLLDGKTPSGIAACLSERVIPSPAGKKQWSTSTVKSILTNEKYKGDALLQKSFTVDFLNKTMKPNAGEVPSYYVRNSHPAIVSEEIFDMAQNELEHRRQSGRKYRGDTCFSGKILCGDCGGIYGSKVWNSNNKYRRMIWQCNQKFKNAPHCTTPHLMEAEIQQAFVDAINGVLRQKADIMDACREMVAMLCDTSTLKAERDKSQNSCNELLRAMQDMVRENARTAQNQVVYDEKYGALTERYRKATDNLNEINGQLLECKARTDRLNAYMDVLQERTLVTAFDEGLWNATVETLTVKNDGTFIFHWRDGSETVC